MIEHGDPKADVPYISVVDDIMSHKDTDLLVNFDQHAGELNSLLQQRRQSMKPIEEREIKQLSVLYMVNNSNIKFTPEAPSLPCQFGAMSFLKKQTRGPTPKSREASREGGIFSHHIHLVTDIFNTGN